ncbi:unnamed protein product, partial [Ixodes persulcatus]
MHQTKQLQAHCTSTVDGFSSVLYYCSVILIPWNYKGSEVNIHGAIDVAGLHNASWDASHIDMHLDGGTGPFMGTYTPTHLCGSPNRMFWKSVPLEPLRKLSLGCHHSYPDALLGAAIFDKDFDDRRRSLSSFRERRPFSKLLTFQNPEFSFMLKRKYETSWDRPTAAVVITTLIIFWLPSSPPKITLGGVSLLLTTFLIDSVTKEFTGSSNVPPIGVFLRSLAG